METEMFYPYNESGDNKSLSLILFNRNAYKIYFIKQHN